MKIFDAHFHIIDTRFPLIENQGFLPNQFTVDDYLSQIEPDYIGGAIVSGSFQGFDSSYLIDALNKLGESYFGVANIPMSITKEELENLNNAGVKAVRFNLNRAIVKDEKEMVYLSHKLLEEYDWHTELYVDSVSLKSLSSCLKKLPRFSIDHLGLSADGLEELYTWVEKGAIIKATGFGRINFDPLTVMKKIYSINPDALIFGTDLPSTRAKRPFSKADVALITSDFSEIEQEKILYTNAVNWYNKSGKSFSSI